MALTKAKLLEIINSGALDSAIFLRQHRVGDLVFSTVNTNPGTIYGGTWIAWGSGRVPVGVDTGQAEFNAVEKTGGAKTQTLTVNEMPQHTHDVLQNYFGSSPYGMASPALVNTASWLAGYISLVGGNAPHNNLQPYITCYVWKRTA